jgi:hypothetical protein
MYTLYYDVSLNAFTMCNTWLNKYTPLDPNPYSAIKDHPHITLHYTEDILPFLFTIETVNDPKDFYYTDIFKVNRDFPELLI